MFLYKNRFFFQYLPFFQSQSCLVESTAAIFRQSAGYVIDTSHRIISIRKRSMSTKWNKNIELSNCFCTINFSVFSILIGVMGINGGYFPAICWACLHFEKILRSFLCFTSNGRHGGQWLVSGNLPAMLILLA